MLCSSSVSLPGIILRGLLVHTLFYHHTKQVFTSKNACLSVCLFSAVRTERQGELTLQPDPLLIHLPVGVSAGPPALACHSQSDGRTGRSLFLCVYVSVCVYEHLNL